MLVTRLTDRRALTRLVRAALRHEVAEVHLAEGPRQAQPHTLDLHFSGANAVSLLAEPAGVPQNGSFPLRLRPLHRAQAAELYALLEAEHVSESEPVGVFSVSPDTLSQGPRTLAFEGDSAPLARSITGAPPPMPIAGMPEASLPPSTKKDDPKKTDPSPSWARPPVPQPAAGDAEDRSISVSVDFDSDVAPAAEPSTERPAEPDFDAGGAGSDGPATMVTPPGEEPFFDDALLNLPAISLDEELAGEDGVASSRTSAAPRLELVESSGELEDLAPSSHDVSGDEVKTDAPTAGGEPWDDELETIIRLPGSAGNMAVARATAGFEDGNGVIEPEPASGAAASDRALIVPVPLREDLTPTNQRDPRVPKSTTGSGRKKKNTTKRGTTKNTARSRKDEEAPVSVRGRQLEGDTDPLLGRKIGGGKYAIESLIGSGAAGAVYKATHRELRRTVAIKVLHPHYQQDPHFMKSFRGEALAASQLDHPNVMRVLDFGQEPDGLVYIVMEHLSGRTLQSLLDEERRLPPERAVEIMIQVCAALSVAHDNGIIHRDIKPDNIMLVPSRNDEGGTFELVKVCDFGIAALENPRAEDVELGIAEGVIAGTPEYMAPEQARGAEIDARSDVYACGICLYELVTGRPPFLGENPAEILIKQLEEIPRPPSALLKGLDPLLEEIILRSIQKDPLKRQQSARELRVELKEIIDPVDATAGASDDERSIVESVPGLDDPASGFAGFFMGLSSAALRVGSFERGHPDAGQAMKDLRKATRAALRGRVELTFARRDTSRGVGYVVMSGHAEIVDVRRLLGALYASHGEPFIELLVKKGIASLTLREGIPDVELDYLVEMLLGGLAHEPLRKELFAKSHRFISVLFASDVVGRSRKLTWKVGLCASRLARDLRALSTVRGISLKKMREIREDLVAGAAHLLTKGEEVRQFLYNADLVDEVVANLRGFSSFHTAPVAVQRLLHDPCVEGAALVLEDYDVGEIDTEVLRGYLRLFATRLVNERSPKSDALLAELHKRSLVTDEDIPRDLKELIRAEALAEALIRDPSQFLLAVDHTVDPEDYARELSTLEAAMRVLARRAEAGALLAAVSMLARHAKASGAKPGAREQHALKSMKSIIDKQRLVPVANALLSGPPHQREPARQLLVLAGSAGAQALYAARESTADPAARATFVQVFRETGPAGWSLLAAILPRLEVMTEGDLALVEDLLRALPDRPDPVLGEAVAKYLAHPRLRPAALAAIVPLWGDRAKKPLVDALEFAEEPARIVATTELRRMRAIDEQVVTIIERLLTMRGSASEELRAVAASALGDALPPVRPRVVAFLSRGIEAKRGFLASLRGDGGSDESVFVTEAMARALMQLDRVEATRAIKARLQRADGHLRARLTAVLQQA